MTEDQLADIRAEKIDTLLSELLRDMQQTIENYGGDSNSFRDYLGYKEVIGEMDEALMIAFSGVEDIVEGGLN